MTKRLFIFGCSFTSYGWTTWPEILAEDMDVPFYNYGAIGAGNQFMANMLMQADSYFDINKDDIVVICWTNVCREDRYINGKWNTPGNIFSQTVYEESWVKEFCDPVGMALRDYATIKSVDTFLQHKGCKYEFLSMLDLTTVFDQFNWNILNSIFNNQQDKEIAEIKKMFKPSLDKIKPSFYEVLWNNKIDDKFKSVTSQFNNFSDCHPTPIEHLTYLQKVRVLDIEFKQSTIDKVNNSQKLWYDILKEWDLDPNRTPAYPHKRLYMETAIRSSMETRGLTKNY
jgi:hypothetical protein